MECYIPGLAVLFGALSLLHRRGRSEAGFLPLLAALAPVVAKGIGSLISHKQAGNAAKTAEAQRKQDALAADAQAKLDWETQQNNPANQTARFKNTFTLGKLAGHLGGMANVPKSIAAYYNSLRTMPTYTGQSSYQEPVKAGGGGWNLAAGITDALGYFDPSQIGKGKVPMSPGQPVGNATPQFQTGQLAQLFKPKNPGFSSGTQNFG